MGSLCEVGMEEERALASPMFWGLAGGGLRAPAVGLERPSSLELTDRLLLQEKPEVGDAIVAIGDGAIVVVDHIRGSQRRQRLLVQGLRKG